MASQPRVTVLMPVYDGERYLREAMDSILAQSWRDLELLVMDDGSRDSSAEIASSYRDPRVRLHRNPRNLGLVVTLNAGLELARSVYVARMDADDIAHPRRVERQVRFLDANPGIAVLGTGVRNFGGARGGWTMRHAPAAVRARLLFDCAISHPTVMMRAEVLRRHGLRYDPSYAHAEDYALWAAVAEHADVANLRARLLRYRTHERQVSKTHSAAQLLSTRRIHERQLARLGLSASEDEITLHERIAAGRSDATLEFLERADAWLGRLCAAASRLPAADRAALAKEIDYRWGRICRRSNGMGLGAWRRFRASRLRGDASAQVTVEVALGAMRGAAAALLGRGRSQET